MTAPVNQALPDALLIEGYIPNLGVATITLKISGRGGFSLPDQYIRTTTKPGKTDGWFSYQAPVTEPGNYYVEIHDRDGFMTTIRYTVEAPAPVTTTLAGPDGPSEEPSPSSPMDTSFPLAALAAGIAGAAIICVMSRK